METVILHTIPAGSTITAVEENLWGAHIEYQNGTKLTHVNAKFVADRVNVDVLECDSKNMTLGIG